MEIQGRIKTIFATETVGQNGFQKRDVVITTDGQYPQDIIIQFAQGNCAVLDRFQVGQMVKIHFNLQGREWTSPQGEVKYFNTVVGWKIEVVQAPTRVRTAAAICATCLPSTRAAAISAGANV